MSDINISGIPNMGFAGGGGGYFGGIPNQQPAMSADQINASMWGRYSPQQAQVPLQNNFNNFGQQTDYYSALGAAYGRQTGGFGGYGVPSGGGGGDLGWDGTSYTRGGGGSVFDTGAAPFSDYGQRALPDTSWYQQSAPSRDPWAGMTSGYAPTAGVDFSYLRQAQAPAPNPYGGGGGDLGWDGTSYTRGATNPYAQMYRMPDANPSYFNPGTYAGDQGNYGIPNNGRAQPGDIGFSRQSPMPNLGYNPGMSNWFANPGMSGGEFQSRFGMGFPNAGTPSQYAPGAQMPPGFSGAYSFDNQGGALGWDGTSYTRGGGG